MKYTDFPQRAHCLCGKRCLGCNAEWLAVTLGSAQEAKQYEYDIERNLGHTTHSKSRKDNNIQKISHQDHEAAMTSPHIAKEMEADMRRRFWVSLALTVPIVLYSELGVKFIGKLPTPLPTNWLLLILTTPVVFWTGSIFISGTYYSLKARKLNMSVLIATGVLAAYSFSVLITLGGNGQTFFDAAAMLVTFVLFGHWMEMRSRRGTSDALRALFDLVPPKAIILRNNKEVIVLSADLKIGDTVIIKPGDKIPVDGEIIKGQTTIDESLVTGESVPVDKKVGDRVIGGSINKTGSVQFRVTQVGGETTLAQIIRLVEEAQNSKAPAQRIADTAAAYLVVLAVSSGIFTFIAWYFFAAYDLLNALTFAISATVIACPDALGLATPTVVAVGTGIGARHNILIKNATTLEQTSKIQVVIMDKTGTLTEGKPSIFSIISIPEINHGELLYLAGSAQKFSNHPFAHALVREAERRSIALSDHIEEFQAITGQGIQAYVDGRKILVGTINFLNKNGIDVSILLPQAEDLMSKGVTVSLVAAEGKAIGISGIGRYQNYFQACY